jgi:hypothetical protein
MSRKRGIVRGQVGLTLFGVALATGLAACGPGDAPQPEPATPAAGAEAVAQQVHVYFTEHERPRPVTRTVPQGADPLGFALGELLRGPEPEESAVGMSSFFSPATAGLLESVSVDREGHAIVDFEGLLRALIPNASTSAGSAAMLGELDSTVFQFPEVRSVEYRLDGSCDAFWNWLQRDCEVVRRTRD